MEEIKFKDGYPEERGLYKVLVDGEETILVHHKCDMTGKHWWSDVRGHDVTGHKIKFWEKKLSHKDI